MRKCSLRLLKSPIGKFPPAEGRLSQRCRRFHPPSCHNHSLFEASGIHVTVCTLSQMQKSRNYSWCWWSARGLSGLWWPFSKHLRIHPLTSPLDCPQLLHQASKHLYVHSVNGIQHHIQLFKLWTFAYRLPFTPRRSDLRPGHLGMLQKEGNERCRNQNQPEIPEMTCRPIAGIKVTVRCDISKVEGHSIAM